MVLCFLIWKDLCKTRVIFYVLCLLHKNKAMPKLFNPVPLSNPISKGRPLHDVLTIFINIFIDKSHAS
jgi:hypothetical protein